MSSAGAGPRLRRRARLALSGVLAGLAGIAVSLATAGALNQQSNPILAVGDTIVDYTPDRVREAAIQTVGTNDKPLLVTGVTVVLVLLCAVAGLLSGRSPLLGNLVFLALGLTAAGAVMSRPDATSAMLLPVVLGAATWLLVLPWLVSRATPPDAVAAGEPDQPTRRGFLLAAAAVGSVTVAVGVGSRFLGRARRVAETARLRLRLPVSEGAVPAGADVGADLGLNDVRPWRIPIDEFYRIDTALFLPAIKPDEWQLRIHGMVERELVLTYRDLLDRDLTEAWVTICCVSNEVGGDLIGNAWWSGVRIADLLAEAGVQPGADAVLQTSEDGWNCGTPLEVLTDDRNAMLAVAMNGAPLPLEHGFPVRMVVPGLYGYVSATKWLVDLEVTRFDAFVAYWTQRGWSAQGPIKTQSRIDVPRGNHRVMAGQVRVAGQAWAQHTGVERVEVRLDEGSWTEVSLGVVPSVDTWVQWTGTVEAEPGTHTLAVRATDRSGATQTSEQQGVVPDGATGWHTIEFTAE